MYQTWKEKEGTAATQPKQPVPSVACLKGNLLLVSSPVSLPILITIIMGFNILGARASTYAAISTFFSVIFTVIAFSTPYWLSADGKSSRRTFLNLGLWEACFTSFQHPNYLYDREFRGCKWLFDEDYTFLLDILEPRKSLPFS